MESRWQLISHHTGLLVLRLGIGGFMLVHGWGKAQMVFDGKFDQMSDPIGLGPTLSLFLITLAEFGGALLVMAGMATRVAAASLVFGMAVAAFVAHGADPWTMGEGAHLFMTGAAKSWSSKEPALLFGIVFLGLMFTGPGAVSFDHLIWPPVQRWWAARKAQAATSA